MATTPQFVGTAHIELTKFIDSDGTNYKSVFVPASGGSRLMALAAGSDDTAARQFHISLVAASVRYKFDTFTVPGATVTQPTTNFNILDGDWLRWLVAMEYHLLMPSGITIEIAPVVAVTAGKEVSIFAFAGDF
ncbi:hypothetical protein EKD04_009675 [Chloroflexales bacterium ZM16-3]|nr:hypothetical protein [Chloroflexales bacterium ZM16-3]